MHARGDRFGGRVDGVARCLREQLERRHDAGPIFGGHAAHDGIDLAAALLHHDVDETLTLGRELDHDLAPVDGRGRAHDEAAGDEPAAHTGHRRSVHVEPLGEGAHGLRTLERDDAQRSQLRQGDLVADRREGAHGDPHERPAGAHDGVDDVGSALLSPVPSHRDSGELDAFRLRKDRTERTVVALSGAALPREGRLAHGAGVRRSGHRRRHRRHGHGVRARALRCAHVARRSGRRGPGDRRRRRDPVARDRQAGRSRPGSSSCSRPAVTTRR